MTVDLYSPNCVTNKDLREANLQACAIICTAGAAWLVSLICPSQHVFVDAKSSQAYVITSFASYSTKFLFLAVVALSALACGTDTVDNRVRHDLTNDYGQY